MYKKILIPIAMDHSYKGDTAIAAAKALSDPEAELILLHVLEEIPAYANAELPEDIFETARKEVKIGLRQFALDADANAKEVVVQGHAGSTIVQYAEANNVDCIVIESHRPEWTDYLLGSTAARVVRHASCSVHVIR